VPEIHDEDPLAQLLHHREVMTDEQQAQAGLALQLRQQRHDLLLRRYIQGTQGLIAYQQLRREDHGARDRDALALAAGELVRVTLAERGLQADALQCRAHRRAASGGGELPGMHAQSLAHDLVHPLAPIEARERILEDDLQLRTQGAQLL